MSQKGLNRSFKRAQAVVEYVCVTLAILGLFLVFLDQVKGHLQTYHDGMVNKIATQ